MPTPAPPPSGPFSLVLAALQAQAASFALAVDGAAVPIEVRKQLTIGDGFPVCPVLVLFGGQSAPGERWFAGPFRTWKVPYRVGMALVLPGRLDFAGVLAGELGLHLDWQSAVAANLGEPDGWGLDPNPILTVGVDRYAPVDPGYAEKGYDVNQVAFDVTVMEDH